MLELCAWESVGPALLSIGQQKPRISIQSIAPSSCPHPPPPSRFVLNPGRKKVMGA
ncbi:hypothetical protein PAMP_023390 [Pampus punctatissimus]